MHWGVLGLLQDVHSIVAGGHERAAERQTKKQDDLDMNLQNAQNPYKDNVNLIMLLHARICDGGHHLFCARRSRDCMLVDSKTSGRIATKQKMYIVKPSRM